MNHTLADGGPPARWLDDLSPRRLTAAYLAFGIGLLLVSEFLVPALVADPLAAGRVQAFEAGIEVALTGGFIYLLTSRSRARLDRSEARYRNVVENTPAPINLFDEDGRTVWGNDAVLDLLDLGDRSDLVGRSIFEFIHEDDHDLARRELREVVDAGEVTGPTRMRLRTDDGDLRHVRVATALGWEDGERVGQAMVLDETERREREREIRALAEEYETVFENARDALFLVDVADDGPTFEFRRSNPAHEAASGIPTAELRGKTPRELLGEEVGAEVAANYRRCYETCETVEYEEVLPMADRSVVWRTKLSPVVVDGEVTQIVGIARDITERRDMERELRENERRYRTLVEMSPEPVVVHADGEIVFANEAAVDFYRAADRGELLGRSIASFHEDAVREDVERSAAGVQRGEATPDRSRRTLRTLAGEERTVEITSRPIAYEGEPAVLSVIADVTDRHRYERRLTTLHDRTRAMARAEDAGAVTGIAVETAAELVEGAGAVYYAFDDGGGLAAERAAGVEVDSQDRVEDGPLWEAFVDGSGRFTEADASVAAGRPFDATLLVPAGNHGLLVVDTGGGPPDRSAVELANLVGEALEAALDRAEREASLRERDRRLARQNETLEQLDRLNGIIREVVGAVIRSSTRAEIGDRVCREFDRADEYAFAWIADRDPVDGTVEVGQWAGIGGEAVDGLGAEEAGSPLADLVAAAYAEGSVHTVTDVLDDPDWAPLRETALNLGFRSVAAVPVGRREQIECVLLIHGADPGGFDERERAVLAELGDTVGYALANVERVEAVGTVERMEVEVAVADPTLFTNRIAAELDARVELVGLVPAAGDTVRAFLRLVGDADGAAAAAAIEELPAVDAARALADEDGTALLQVTLETPPFVRLLAAHHGRIASLDAAAGSTDAGLVLPGDADVREVVEELREAYADVQLLARREHASPPDTREGYREAVLDGLTERQREALRSAFYGGFYEWPRTATSEELADSLGIASSTFQYHLRAAERKTVSNLLEPV